jgi:hypothetical protein
VVIGGGSTTNSHEGDAAVTPHGGEGKTAKQAFAEAST